jgi:basic amino acid/polyamine antiporter, APA family
MNKKLSFPGALLTAVGMVIGSGIFFKASAILKFTQGNIMVAVLGWIVLGTTIIFAGLSVSTVAKYSGSSKGAVGYVEDVLGKVPAFIVGWYETAIYSPLLPTVTSLVAARYLLQLIGFDMQTVSNLYILILGAAILLGFYLFNYLSEKYAAKFSSIATVIKLLPVVIFGLVGIVNIDAGKVGSDLANFDGSLFIAPLLSMGFAFNGWVTTTALGKDMREPSKLPKILALNLIVVTAAYVIYFFGISMLGQHYGINIIETGEAHVGLIADKIFGDIGGKLILFCVLMSVLGLVNGKVMGGYRFPFALAQSNDLPKSKYFTKTSKYGTPARAGMITLGITAIWFILFVIQYMSKDGLTEAQIDAGQYALSGITLDDIPVMGSAVEAIILMLGAFKVFAMKKDTFFKTVIATIIGIIGQMFIIISFVQTNEAAWTYMGILLLIIIFGLVMRYFARRNLKSKNA